MSDNYDPWSAPTHVNTRQQNARANEPAHALPDAVYSGNGVNTSVVSNAAQPGAIPANYLTNTASVGSVYAPPFVGDFAEGITMPANNDIISGNGQQNGMPATRRYAPVGANPTGGYNYFQMPKFRPR